MFHALTSIVMGFSAAASGPLHLSSDEKMAALFPAIPLSFAEQFPLRILIADDNYINRRVLTLFLQRLGYEAHSTENGRECLKAVMDGPYDLLLTDIDMPEMDGIECTHLIRQAGIDLPIIAMTALPPAIKQEQCMRAGMNGYMTKPVDFPGLKDELKTISERRLALTSQP
jgi:CheY-like chemotaxis protein